MLANYAEANKYLDLTKVGFANNDDASDEIDAADSVIRSNLFDVFGDVVYTWEYTPGTGQVQAPDAVTERAAMWMAALRYAKVYSEETLDENSWSARLFAMVNDWFGKLRTGEVTIPGITSGIAFSEDDFWPNSTDVDPSTGISNRKFTMSMEL